MLLSKCFMSTFNDNKLLPPEYHLVHLLLDLLVQQPVIQFSIPSPLL